MTPNPHQRPLTPEATRQAPRGDAGKIDVAYGPGQRAPGLNQCCLPEIPKDPAQKGHPRKTDASSNRSN